MKGQKVSEKKCRVPWYKSSSVGRVHWASSDMAENITPGMSLWNFRPLKTKLVFITPAPDFLWFVLKFRQKGCNDIKGQEVFPSYQEKPKQISKVYLPCTFLVGASERCVSMTWGHRARGGTGCSREHKTNSIRNVVVRIVQKTPATRTEKTGMRAAGKKGGNG